MFFLLRLQLEGIIDLGCGSTYMFIFIFSPKNLSPIDKFVLGQLHLYATITVINLLIISPYCEIGLQLLFIIAAKLKIKYLPFA